MVCRWDLGLLVGCGMVSSGDDVLEVFPETCAVPGFGEDRVGRYIVGGPWYMRSGVVFSKQVIMKYFE